MRASSLCLAETITSLIETKTIADRHFARGRSSRDETSARLAAARTAVDYRRFIARKSSAGSPPFLAGSQKEVEIGGPFSALDLPECIRLCRIVGVEAFLTRIRPRNSPRDGGFDIPFHPAHAAAALSSLRRGTHERVLGGLLYICMGIRKHACMFAHTRSRQPSL